MSIDNGYQIPADASANVHSVSAVGEQYLDLVSTRTAGPYLHNLQTITKTTVPSQIGPALDAANRGLAALPKDKVASLLHETSQAVGGLGPSLRRLVDATGAIAHDFKGSIDDIDDIIAHAGPIIDSQVDSGDDIARWAGQSQYPDLRRPRNRIRPFATFWPTPRPPPIKSRPRSTTYGSRCRRRWPTSRSYSTCSSATTMASSRRWCSCRSRARSPRR